MMGVVFYFMIIWIIHGLVIYRLFKSGTCSYKLTKVNAKDPDGNWFCVGMELPEEFEKLLACREEIVRAFKQFGFEYTAMELGGYRTGSMNGNLGKTDQKE